jgi:hypothetical protein
LPPHDSFNESERYHLGFDLPEDWPLEDPPAPGPLPTKPSVSLRFCFLRGIFDAFFPSASRLS